MSRMPTDADLEYTRFGLAPGQIEAQTWLDPVSGVRGMGRPPGMMVVRLEIDSSTARSSYIGARCVEMVRSQSWFILEWDRLNPEMLRFFFVRMIRDTGFRLFYKNLNDSMRLCHLRIFDVLAPKGMQSSAGTEPGCVENTDEGEIGLEEVWLENSFDLLCFSLYIKQKDGVYPKIVHSSFYSYVI